ncbi:MerR family transcriptional regulator [Adlercreutzia sp. ZJ154]|uniref:MerR family transcriptional regulator n=1 Tax=Adlercreutzia sp. ZJ154 TaxID=2709790 RepID=UPI0013ED891F|nr:MerR family transcriptional regulator [Adlercreutzia sp. ZJ154]
MASEDQGRSWSIGEMANMSGVSARALRHYESQGLLQPTRTESGYRQYFEKDAKRLTQVLAMKACGMQLGTIRRILCDPNCNLRAALYGHLGSLRKQTVAMEEAVSRTESALFLLERIEGMEPKDAFEELKKQGLEDFEATYGKEARQLYGDAAIDATNERMMNLTKDEWDAKELLEEAIKVQLRIAKTIGNPTGEEAQELARMHERWISIHWGKGYEKDAYLGLVRSYANDPRFVEYYDNAAGEGATAFLIEAVENYQIGQAS